MAIEQIDYGDYHKFKVSLGVACIIGAFVLPWVFLSESFDLLIESEQLSKLSETARSLIKYRQSVAAVLIRFVPIGSALLLITGFWLIVRGLAKWKNLQQLVDLEQQLKVTKLGREIELMSPEEISDKATAEVSEVENGVAAVAARDIEGVTQSAQLRTVVSHYLKVEKAVIEKLSHCLGLRYSVLPKRRLGKAEFDCILLARSNAERDLIVEIKYAQKNFGRNWVTDTVLKAILATELYSKSSNRAAVAATFFVSPRQLLERKKTEEFKAFALAAVRRVDASAVVQFIVEEELDSLTCGQVEEMIKL